MHKHQCPSCFTVWQHDNSSAGDERAHSCPECGLLLRGSWFHYDGESPATYSCHHKKKSSNDTVQEGSNT